MFLFEFVYLVRIFNKNILCQMFKRVKRLADAHPSQPPFLESTCGAPRTLLSFQSMWSCLRECHADPVWSKQFSHLLMYIQIP